MPRQHRFALGPRFSEQPVVVAPLPDLQQLPTEHLRKRLARQLALERIHALAKRRAQPGVQVEGGGPRLDAEPVWYDPRNDVALLRVPAVESVPALELNVNARPGASAAILGFPGNGPYDVQAGRLGRTQTIRTEDAYGRGPVERRITALRGRVRSGNSGGPMVDGRGRVVTTIFAASVGSGGRTGFGVPDSVVQDALARAEGPVGTGACAH